MSDNGDQLILWTGEEGERGVRKDSLTAEVAKWQKSCSFDCDSHLTRWLTVRSLLD